MTFFFISLFFLFWPKNQTSKRTFYLRIDTSFTENQYKSIENATTRWETATQNRIKFNLIHFKVNNKFNPILEFVENFHTQDTLDTDRTVLIWNGNGTKLDDLETSLKFKIKGFTPGSYIALVSSRMTDTELEVVTIHELGHLIGLQHTKTIMNPDVTSSCITNTDMLQYCKVYQCDLKDTVPECEF